MAGQQVTSGDIYRNTGELEQLEAQLIDIEKELDRIHKVAEALEKRLSGFNITKSGDRQKIREVADETARLAQAQAALTAQQTEVGQKIAATKNELTRLNQEQKANARLASSAATSYDSLSAQYTLNKLRLNQLTVAERENTQEGRALVAQTKAIYAEMNRLQELTGVHTLKVGNYTGAINRLGTSLFQLGAAYISVQGLQSAIGSIFGETKAINSLDIALKTVLGAETAAADAKEYLADITDRLGTNLLDTSRSYLQFTIAANQAGFAQEKTNGIFESFVKVGATLGLRTDELDGIFKAITQIISKGTVQSEELRGQLGDRLPGAFGIFAKAIGVTTPQLSDMLKKGEVLATDTLPKFAAELERTYGVDTINRVDTLAAAQGRFSRELTLIIKDLNASNVFKEFFNTLTEVFKILRDNLPAVLNIGKGVLYLAAAWTTWKLSMVAANSTWLLSLRLGVLDIAQKGLQATTTAALTRATHALNAAVKANPIGLLLTSAVLVIGALSTLRSKFDGLREAQNGVAASQRTAASEIVKTRATVDALLRTYGNERNSLETRKKAIEDIEAIMPGVFSNLDKTKLSYDLAKAAVDGYVASLESRLRVENLTSKLGDALKLVDEIDAKLDAPGATKANRGSGLGVLLDTYLGTTTTSVGLEKRKREILIQIDEIKKAIETEINRIPIAPSPPGTDPNGPTGPKDKNLLDEFERLDELNKLRDDGREKDLESERIRFLRSRQLFIKNGIELAGLNEFYQKRQNEINLKYDNLENDQFLKSDEAKFAASGKSALEIANYKRKIEVDALQYLLDVNDQYNGTLTANQIAENEYRISILKQEIEKGDLEISLESLRRQNELGQLRLKAAGVTDAEIERQRIDAEIAVNQRILDADKTLTEDQRAIYQAHIDYLKRQRAEAEVNIGLETLQREQDLEESRFNLVKRTAQEKQALAIRFEIQRIEKILALDKTLSEAQIEIFRNQIATLQNELTTVNKSKPIDFFSLLGISGVDDDEKAAIGDTFQFLKDQMTGFFDLQRELTQEALQQSNDNLSQKRQALSVELDLLRQGYANRAGFAQKEYNDAKKRQEQALKDARKAQIAQLEINTALEASNLILAVAKVLSTIPPPFNIVAAGAMLGTFAIAKVKAFQIAKKREFRKGGYEEIGGGTHASGTDTYIGSSGKSDLYAERDESIGVFNAPATRRYRSQIRNFVNAANRMELDATMNTHNRFAEGIPFISNVVNLDQERVEAELIAIRKELAQRRYQDTKGRLVEEEPGRKTTWVS